MPTSSFLDARGEKALSSPRPMRDSNKKHHHIFSHSSYTFQLRMCARPSLSFVLPLQLGLELQAERVQPAIKLVLERFVDEPMAGDAGLVEEDV